MANRCVLVLLIVVLPALVAAGPGTVPIMPPPPTAGPTATLPPWTPTLAATYTPWPDAGSPPRATPTPVRHWRLYLPALGGEDGICRPSPNC